jgi:hypothetical protein
MYLILCAVGTLLTVASFPAGTLVFAQEHDRKQANF